MNNGPYLFKQSGTMDKEWMSDATRELFDNKREQVCCEMMGERDAEQCRLMKKKRGHKINMLTRWIDFEKPKPKRKGICCFEYCDREYEEFGHNPAPYKFKPEARCCNKCNVGLVRTRRLGQMKEVKTMNGFVGWLQQSNIEITEELIDHATMSELRRLQVEALKNYQEKYFKRADSLIQLRTQNIACTAENVRLLNENKRLQNRMEAELEKRMKEERKIHKKKVADLTFSLEQSKRANKKKRR
jgi:hypothetical protein